jgi:hypothetical protein
VLDRQRKVLVKRLGSTGALENTGAIGLESSAETNLQVIALDEVLVQQNKVRLIKLDCESSEWPILFFCRELWRTFSICGEYHECFKHPFCTELETPLNRDVLRKRLDELFKNVVIEPSGRDNKLGHFWAWSPRKKGNGDGAVNKRSGGGRREETPFDTCGP